jgi:tetratricopeptide (TPR) repeat protein
MELLVAERPRDALAPDIMLRLGQAYTAAGAPDKAIAVYQQLQSHHAKTAAASRSALLVAQALVAKGVTGYVEAEKTLLKLTSGQTGLSRDSDDYCRAALELDKLQYRTERFDEYITRLQDLVTRFPKSSQIAEMNFLTADSFRRDAMKVQAQLASATTTINGNLTQAAATKKQRLTEARNIFDRVIQLYHDAPPTNDSDKQYEKLSYFYRADCVFELGSYGDAIGLYNAAATRYEQDPASLAAYVQIVNCYCAMGKMDEARTANEKAKQLLRRMPAEAFNDGGFIMPKAYWEQWLKWTSTAGAW